jgi:hypothetical protein
LDPSKGTQSWVQRADATVIATYPSSISLLGLVVKSGRMTSQTMGASGMTIDYRTRNIVIAAPLAAAAVLFTVAT